MRLGILGCALGWGVVLAGWGADRRISELVSTNSVSAGDLTVVVTEPFTGSATTRYITLETLLKLAFGATGLTVGRIPYASATNALSDSPLHRVSSTHVGINSTNHQLTSTGTGEFLFQSNGVTVARIALNSGYAGAGTRYLSDDGTFKVFAPASATSVQTLGGGANYAFTNTWQNVIFGSGSPSITLNTSGTYLIYYGASFGANNTFADAFRVHDGTAAISGSAAEGVSVSATGFGGGLGQVHVGRTFTAAITAPKTITLQAITADSTYTGSPVVISTNTVFGAVKLY